MIDRKIYWKKHIAAFFITLFIFLIGLLIGLRISNSRLDLLQSFSEKQRADFESLQLQYVYLTTTNGSCTALRKALEESVNNLENARIKLENYLQSAYESERFLDEKRKYMLAEIRYWLLARQTENSCGKDSVSVLYFYEEDDKCGKCSTQGYILTSLKDKFKDKLLIFSLDASSEEAMVKIIKNVYNINEVPSLVVDDDVVRGFILEDDLFRVICRKFKNKLDVCEDAM